MNITFDARKDALNLAKHGVALAEAQRLEWDWLCCQPDGRRDYGELREVGYAPLAGRVYCVVFVQQAEVFRIISLRRANSREVTDYDQALKTFRVRDPDA